MCRVEWCNNKQTIGKTNLCRNHYSQMNKYGKILSKRPRGKRNEYIIHDDYAELSILDSNGEVIIKSLVDKDDVDKLKKYSFRYEKNRYIKGSNKGKTIYLHQAVMGIYDGYEVDHINRNIGYYKTLKEAMEVRDKMLGYKYN